MADGDPITDAEAIRFVNEQIRPLCEAMRGLKVRILAMHESWTTGGIGDKVNANGSNAPIADGREAEGVSRLIAYKVNVAHDALKAAADAVNDDYVAPPCVRPISL